ncbi:MAG: right-handed parallel beta-helix repeat-containing protein [Planctomycetota bacterium]
MRLSCMIAATLTLAAALQGQTTVGGTISQDTEWSLADSPFLITADVEIIGGATLTVATGVEVDFEPGTSLMVQVGGLVARGREDRRIELRGGEGIRFGDQAIDGVLDPGTGAYVSGSILEHVVLRDVDAGFGAAIEIDRAQPVLRSMFVFDVDGGGIDIEHGFGGVADVRLEDVRIGRTSEEGLRIEGGRSATLIGVELSGIAISDGRGAGMDIEITSSRSPIPSEPDLVLEGCAIEDITGRWGGLLEASWIEIRDAEVRNCSEIGVLARAGRIVVEGSTFTENDTHGDLVSSEMAVRDSVFRRGGRLLAAGVIEDCLFEDNRQGPALVGGSVIRHNTFIGNIADVAGGALSTGGFVDLFDNTFERNSAPSGGAAILGGSILSGGNTFVNNSADFGGALFLPESARRSLVGTPGNPDVFRGNTAWQAGGAVAIDADGLEFLSADFEDNDAPRGGAIYVTALGSGLDLTGEVGPSGVGVVRFAANTAGVGADLYLEVPDSAFPVADSDARCVDWGTSSLDDVLARVHDARDDGALPLVRVLPLGPCSGEPCGVDLDGDGNATLFDFLAFSNLFDADDPEADLDGDGALTLFDFLAFQDAFAQGCP